MDDIKALREETKKLTLLYVEDENEVRAQTKEFFSKYFKQVDDAANGKDGLELFEAQPYDVVISDLKMPVMGGEAMLETIRKQDKRVVLVTMSGVSGSNGWTNNVSDFSLPKPGTMELFIQMLETVVKLLKERSTL
jgi:CheY-like chemotaxis protein